MGSPKAEHVTDSQKVVTKPAPECIYPGVKTGVQDRYRQFKHWIPAFAGMTFWDFGALLRNHHL
jgi:hypothetical protein